MSIHNLLVLPHLPTKQTRRRKQLVDYNMSHVVISEKYLNIMAKTVINDIKKCKQKKRKRNGPRRQLKP